jgi:pyruvate dehydrogenase E2 component (dihydrolipoamide acetyltransferase)
LLDDADIEHWAKEEDITMRLVHAIGKACEQSPALNGWFDGEQLSRRLMKKVDLGIAVDTEEGLFVPVLRDITQRDLTDLRQGLDRLRADVIKRKIPPAEMQGATITLSNFGTIAGRYANPVVVPPQIAIVGAGVIRDEVVAITKGGKRSSAVHRVLPLSVTFDHRAVTGGEAARFMRMLLEDLAG